MKNEKINKIDELINEIIDGAIEEYTSDFDENNGLSIEDWKNGYRNSIKNYDGECVEYISPNYFKNLYHNFRYDLYNASDVVLDNILKYLNKEKNLHYWELDNDIFVIDEFNDDENNDENEELDSLTILKKKQVEIINNTRDEYDKKINIGDVSNLQEQYKNFTNNIWELYNKNCQDFTKKDVEVALKTGKVIIYAPEPIAQGVFITTSQKIAKKGFKNCYSLEVSINDIAWCFVNRGWYAKIEDSKKGEK